jgi:hypothetical protein
MTLRTKSAVVCTLILGLAIVARLRRNKTGADQPATTPSSGQFYRSIVKVRYSDAPGKAEFLGSGVLVSRNGIILTNNHVVENQSLGTSLGTITVHQLTDLTRPPTAVYRAELIVRNDEYDLALIRAAGLRTNEFVSVLQGPDPGADDLEKPVRIMGYPDLGGTSLTITRGVVSGFDEQGNLKTDAEINHGNSGGGAFRENGAFLGLPTFVISEATGKIGYIISVKRIREWLATTMKTGLPHSEDELAKLMTPSNIDFTRNLDAGSRHPRIMSKFAFVEMSLKDEAYDKVLPVIEQILEERPRSPLAFHYLGDSYLGLQEFAKASDAYNRALTLDPYDVAARGNYAVALTQLGQPERALEQYEALLKISDDPDQKALAYYNMGRLYQNAGRNAEASRYYRLALDLKPDLANALGNGFIRTWQNPRKIEPPKAGAPD